MADPANELIQQLSMRPKCYIALAYANQGATTYEITKGAATLSTAFTDVGAIEKLTITSSRETKEWRELDPLLAGKPAETYPGLVSYSLNLSRVVLYASNYLEAFGVDSGHDILLQNKPLAIKVTMPAARDAAGAEVAGTSKTWIIYGVWFKDSAMEFDTEAGDIKLSQDIDAIAAGITAGA